MVFVWAEYLLAAIINYIFAFEKNNKRN